MERIKDDFLDIFGAAVPLKGKEVLEIGCGDGRLSTHIAERCKGLFGIDPDAQKIKIACDKELPNASFAVRSAAKNGLPNNIFDVTLFTLSLHHILLPLMPVAIDEAVRVTKKDGVIVFLEPTHDGAFFDAEVMFDACDGDERDTKKSAQRVISEHPKLERPALWSFVEETGFRFESVQDFVAEMKPQKNLELLEPFLRKYDFCLKAVRHTQIFKPRH